MYFFGLDWFENHFLVGLNPNLFVRTRASGWIETDIRYIVVHVDQLVIFVHKMLRYGGKAKIL